MQTPTNRGTSYTFNSRWDNIPLRKRRPSKPREPFDSQEYADRLQTYQDAAILQAQLSKAGTDKLAKALMCGRIVGHDPGYSLEREFKPRYYCRQRRLCLRCSSLSINNRAAQITDRISLTENHCLYSFVFTSPKPNSTADEIRFARLVRSGMTSVVAAIQNANRGKGDRPLERIHEYVMGLHLKPNENGRFWPHAHLYLVAGCNVHVGTITGGGLAATLNREYEAAFGIRTKTKLRYMGIIGAKVLTNEQAKKAHRKSGVQIEHLRRSIAYAMTLNRIKDSIDTIRTRCELLSTLEVGTTNITSRGTSGVMRRHIPCDFPPASAKSTSLMYPLDGSDVRNVAYSDYSSEQTELTQRAFKLAKISLTEGLGKELRHASS